MRAAVLNKIEAPLARTELRDPFSLTEADRALAELRAGRFQGAAVLVA